MSRPPADIESIERATLAAVAPEEVLEIGGWLVGLDPGSIRLAASAVPLRHDLPAGPEVIDEIGPVHLAKPEQAVIQEGQAPLGTPAQFGDACGRS